MDVILEYFFENFGQLERDSLHARYKRREMVEYFNTLIEGCRRGENCNSEKTVREAILGILRYHDKIRDNNGTVCLMGKYHNILYVAIKLCFDWQLKDTGTVVALLEHIYSCERTFERIFVGAIFGTRAPHYIAGWKSDFDNQEENLRALVYYMDHAANAGLEFCGSDGRMVRFVDVPIESCGKASALKVCVQLGLPDKLHILLRFGAVVDCDWESVSIVESLLNKLNEFNHVYPYNLVACLQLLLRTLPGVFARLDGIWEQREIIQEIYPDLISDGIIPLRRCGIEPTELKHLCRCQVRNSLWKNSQLPNGIRLLHIPESLMRYLDLLED